MISAFIDRLYHRMLPLWRSKKTVRLAEIDFSLPWWNVILRYKGKMVLVALIRMISSMIDIIFPLLAAWAVSTGEVTNYFLVLSLLLVVVIQHVVLEYLYGVALSSMMASVQTSANRFFLQVDPLWHSMRSSGQIISKVNRGANAYESILDALVYDFLRIFTSLFAVTGALFVYSAELGIFGGGMLILITAVSIVMNSMIVNQIAKYRIVEEDKMKALTVENLQEVLLIRSVFATDDQVDKVERQANEVIAHQINSWMLNTLAFRIPWILYIISLAVVGLITFQLLDSGSLDAITAVAILATYSDGSSRLMFIGGRVSRVIQQVKNVQDMFAFIRTFGNQSYPVLSTDNTSP